MVGDRIHLVNARDRISESLQRAKQAERIAFEGGERGGVVAFAVIANSLEGALQQLEKYEGIERN
jgi:hypothetical protein